jgi:hypothetical protein
MRKIAIALFSIALTEGAARAQSVAETLKTLTFRIQSPHVLTRSDEQGGHLLVLDGNQKTTIQLRTDGSGGNIDLNSRSGRTSVYMGTNGSGGEIGIASATSTLYTTYLGTSGLLILDDANSKQLASFTRTDDGTAGQVIVNGTQVHDYAEVFEIAESAGLTPGSVVAASSDGKGIKLSSGAYNPTVVGVISGAGTFQPGMRIGSREDGSSNMPVSVSGQVYVRVSSEAGVIAIGDLLVSSNVPGVAMRGADKTRLTGSVIGKALQSYSGQGESLIRMLVMLR